MIPRTGAVFLALGVVSLGATVGTQRWLERRPGSAGAEEEVRYLPPPAVARRLAFGYDRLAADLAWISTVQYFGRHLERDQEYPHLRDLVEFTVGIDPHFVEAYQYGALFLWVAGNTGATIALLEEGYRQNPGRWELPHDLGRVFFLQFSDPAQALRWWMIARDIPGAPAYLPRFIARLEAKVGNLETALELWQEIERDPNMTEHFRAVARREITSIRPRMRQAPPSR
jgi:tetratricopeptide (TPR) repeat protein